MDKLARQIDVLIYDGVNLLDVSGPVQAFTECCLNGQRSYRLRFVALDDATDCRRIPSSCGLPLNIDHRLSLESNASDLLIPGGNGVDKLLGNTQLRAVIANWRGTRENARLLSVCSGALLLADAGVLDGCCATTHWAREVEVRRRFPKVHWNLNCIMANSDNIHTSAGVTTGIDLALRIIRHDCGTQAALAVARELIVYLTRSGNQSQYAQLIEWQLHDDEPLARLVTQIVEQPAREWTLSVMAQTIDMTPRTLTRRFIAGFDTSPVRFLEQLRVRLAGDLLSTGMPAKRVASRAGFGDVQTLRRAFQRQLGTTLGEYFERFAAN